MLQRRGATPLRSGAPSLEASNQFQIDDLVQRNRTLEHTVKKQSEQLALEATKSKDALADVQKKWQQERVEWRQGCDVLQSCHRIFQLRNTIDIEKERMAVLKEQDAYRREKVKQLQRNFRITSFQIKEAALEDRILELEEEQEITAVEYEEKIRRLKKLCIEHTSRLREKDDQLIVVEQKKEEIEEKLNTLREEHAHLQASSESLSSKLERTVLQLEGAQTKNADLERTNDEIKRSNADMQRQIEKWQNLETKGDAEIETLRKRRIELEVQVQELQIRLEKTVEEYTKALEKEKRKVEKLKTGVQEWQTEAKQLEQEGEETTKRLDQAQKQIETLTVELQSERAKARSSPQKRVPLPSEVSEDEVAMEVSNPRDSSPLKPQVKSKPKPTQKKQKDSEAGPSGAKGRGIQEKPKTTKAKKRPKDIDSDIEEVTPQPRTKGEDKVPSPSVNNDSETDEPPKKSKGKGKAAVIDLEVEAIEPRQKVGSKRKASDDITNQHAPAKEKDGSTARKPASEAKGASGKSRRGRPPNHGGRKPIHEEEEDPEPSSTEEKEAVPKKKRKINIFPSTTEPTAFNFMPQGNSGLNIPTVLSPVKESEGIPSRSTSGSIMGSIGSMLVSSFSRRGA